MNALVNILLCYKRIEISRHGYSKACYTMPLKYSQYFILRVISALQSEIRVGAVSVLSRSSILLIFILH